MARSPFPTGDFGRNLSPDPIGAAIGAPAAATANRLAGAAAEFGGRLKKMADDAWQREGTSDAARVLEAEAQSGIVAALRPGRGVDDQAYNAAIRNQQIAQRQATYAEELTKAELANPDSESRFAEAQAAVRAAFAPTGDPESDLAFGRFATIENVQALNRVRTNQERVRQDTVRGAYVTTSATAGTALGQAIASANLDDTGATLVGASLNQFAASLARYGPREAFSIGGIEFAADANRAGVVNAEKLASDFDAAQAQARMTWILAAGDRAPDAAAKMAFVGQVQERWQAGDPMFAGLGAGEMAQLTGRLEAGASRAATDERAAVAEAGQTARDLLRALEYGGDVDPGEIRARAAASGDPGLIAETEYRLTYGFQVSPRDSASSGGMGGAAAGFGGWVGVLLDQLEGPGLVANDNGAGRAQFGITERSHPEAWRDGRVDRAEASAIYKREYWDAIGGDQLSPEMAFAASSAAVVGGVGTARELLSRANGDVDQFLQLEEARFRGLAAQDPGRYGDDLPGWLNRIGRVRGAIGTMRAQRRATDGYVSNPIGTARRLGLATPAEIDPAQIFDGDANQVSAFLRSRRATGQQLANQDGVPPRIFASEEVAAMKARLEADPGSVVTLTQRAAAALGPDGARAVLVELGENPGDVATHLRIGWLSLDDGGRGFAMKATEGLRLRSEGAPAAAFDSGEGIADLARTYGAGLSARPDDLGPAIAVAEAAAVADQARGMLRPAEHYVQGALGRNPYNNRFYGGMAEHNGAKTLLPAWLRDDGLDDVVGWAAQRWVRDGYGPVFGNGQPIPANRLERMRLRSMPGGQYRLVDPGTGQFVPGRQGRAFEFTLDGEATYDALRRAFPALVRPR